MAAAEPPATEPETGAPAPEPAASYELEASAALQALEKFYRAIVKRRAAGQSAAAADLPIAGLDERTPRRRERAPARS